MDTVRGLGQSLPFKLPDVEEQDVDKFKKRLLRTKTIVSQTSVEGDEEGGGERVGLQKVLTTLDLISLGVGSCCGTGMYVVAGLVAKNVAGPGAIFSFLIAALASILSGVCYGEFGVRVPKTSGSAYMYSYVTVGEFVAFLIGWNLILEYMIGSAAGASALSACFDALSNHTMSLYLEEHVGTVIGRGKTYPDFLGFFIGMGMTVVLAMGVQKSVRFNNILNLVNFICWIFIVIAGLFYVDGSNWRNPGFAPYGASGVFSGAATCFYAFIGFDIIATTGEEAQNASKSIPRAIVSSLVICLIAYISVTAILTLMVPFSEIHGDSALIDMFGQNGAPAAKWVVAIGALCALTVSLLGSMFPMPRVIYAMSRDGLLFESLSVIHPKTNTPLIATVVTGTLASLMSLLVGLQILVEMMSIGTLLAYTLVSVSVLILRYQPSSVDVPIPMAHRLDPIIEGETPPEETMNGGPIPSKTTGQIMGPNGQAVNEEYKLKDAESLITPTGEEPKNYGAVGGKLGSVIGGTPVETGLAFCIRNFKIYWHRAGFPGDDMLPNEATAKTAIIFVGVLAVCEFVTCLLIVFGADPLYRGAPWAVLLLIFFLGTVVACMLVILRQPQNTKKLDFMAPCVPFLPAFAMFFNMYLMLKLPGLTWARLGIWICIGLLLYFGYSMLHSKKERKAKEKELFDQFSTDKQMQNAMNGDAGVTSLPDQPNSIGHHPGGPPAETNDPWKPIPATGTGSSWAESDRPSTMGKEHNPPYQQAPEDRASGDTVASWGPDQQRYDTNNQQREERFSEPRETSRERFNKEPDDYSRGDESFQRGASGRVSWEQDKRESEERTRRMQDRQRQQQDMGRYRHTRQDNPYHEGY